MYDFNHAYSALLLCNMRMFCRVLLMRRPESENPHLSSTFVHDLGRSRQLMPVAHSPSRTDAGPAGPASGGHGAVLRQETGRSGGRRMPSAAMTAQGSSGSSVATARRSIPTATS